jgi:hypothetical protein
MDSARWRLPRPVPTGVSKTTENNTCYINPMIDESMRELYRLTRPEVYASGKKLTYSHSELKECPMHKHPGVYVRVYHNFVEEYYGYRDICLCLSCLIRRR